MCRSAGSQATYNLYMDADPNAGGSTLGTHVTAWSQTDDPNTGLVPFYQFLLSAGQQYVLRIDTRRSAGGGCAVRQASWAR